MVMIWIDRSMDGSDGMGWRWDGIGWDWMGWGSGDVNVVVELLEQGDDVNCRGAQMRTPLHRAVGKGHNACVEVLIKHNADLNMVDGGGLTPLYVSSLSPTLQPIRDLISLIARCTLD